MYSLIHTNKYFKMNSFSKMFAKYIYKQTKKYKVRKNIITAKATTGLQSLYRCPYIHVHINMYIYLLSNHILYTDYSVTSTNVFGGLNMYITVIIMLLSVIATATTTTAAENMKAADVIVTTMTTTTTIYFILTTCYQKICQTFKNNTKEIFFNFERKFL